MKARETGTMVIGSTFGVLVFNCMVVIHRYLGDSGLFGFTSVTLVDSTLGALLGGILSLGVVLMFRKNRALEEDAKKRTQELAELEQQRSATISKLSQANEDAKNQSKLLDTLLEALPIPVFFKDPEGRYLGCNKAFKDFFGKGAEELKGKTVFELYPEEMARIFFEADQRLLNTLGSEVYEAMLPNSVDLQRDLIICKATYKKADGSVGGFVGTCLDITERKEAEKRLSEFAQRLDLALRGADLGFWDWNVKTGEVLYSDRFITMLGHSPDEVQHVIDWWQERLHPDDKDRVIKEIMEHLKGRTPILICEYRLETKSNEWLWMLARGKVVEFDEAGKPLRAVGTQLDITDRRRSREALRNHMRLIRGLLTAIPNPVFMKDSHGRLITCNRAYEEFTGLQRQLIKGKMVSEFWPAHGAEAIEDAESRLLVNPGVLQYEVHVSASGGRLRDCIMSEATFQRSDGSVSGFVGVMVDITERKKIERSLKESEEQYRTLVENSGQIIAITQNDMVVFINPRINDISGFDQSELEGNPLTRIIHPDDGALLVKDVQGNGDVSFKNIGRQSFRIVTKTLDERWVEDNPVVIMWNEKPATLHFITDVTDRKRAEAMLVNSERLKAVADLSSGVAHNFNNALQIIIGGAGLALLDLESGETQRVKSQLKQIIDSSRFAAGTVRRLEDFANLDSVFRVGVQDRFDLSDLAKKTINMTELWWKTNPEKIGVTIKVESNLSEGVIVNATEEDLFEVVVNLIKNAVEALPKGGEISVRTVIENDYAVLQIKDNGIGIAKENMEKIFQPFWTTKGLKATGMGLSSSLGILIRLHGDLKVHSELGKGSTFEILLPIERPTPGQEINETRASGDQEPLSILVVDDLDVLVDLLKEGLSELGHTVYCATSGKEALKIFEENIIDVVISDLGMPEMSGWDVCRAVKKINKSKDRGTIPFILLTGWGNQQLEDELIKETGVDAVAHKPVDLISLSKIISEVTGSSK